MESKIKKKPIIRNGPISRREMLLRLGGFSAAAAGVLMDLTFPAFAQSILYPPSPFPDDESGASETASTLDFISPSIRAGDLLEIYSSKIGNIKYMDLHYPLLIKIKNSGINNHWTTALNYGNGRASMVMPLILSRKCEEITSRRLSIEVWARNMDSTYCLGTGVINYTRSPVVKQAGGQMKKLVNGIFIMLLDTQSFAERHFPQDLYNKWRIIKPALYEAAVELNKIVDATYKGATYSFKNLKGERLKFRPQEMAILDRVLSGLSLEETAIASEVAIDGDFFGDFFGDFIDRLNTGLVGKIHDVLPGVTRLVNFAVPAAGALAVAGGLGTVGAVAAVGAIAFTVTTFVPAATMFAMGYSLNEVLEQGAGLPWVKEGLSWLGQSYLDLAVDHIGSRFISALPEGLGRDILDVLGSGNLVTAAQAAASYAGAGTWNPYPEWNNWNNWNNWNDYSVWNNNYTVWNNNYTVWGNSYCRAQ